MKRLREKTQDSALMANRMFFNRGAVLPPTGRFFISFVRLFLFISFVLSFSSSELKLHEAFVNQSQEFYDSVPQKLSNDSAANVKLINEWVRSKTQSRITELVDSLDDSCEFVLLNAVYFIGQFLVFTFTWICSVVTDTFRVNTTSRVCIRSV